MTPSGFLTDEAWQQIVPLLCKGIRVQVREAAASLGIDEASADRLLVGMTFDGFKSHIKNLGSLVEFANFNIRTAVENRDSSEMNQAFDRFVARAGKKRAATCLDELRRSHIAPVIDKWALVLVGLSMLRDCDSSNVWEASFVAVNMHPLCRISFEDWIQKIQGFVDAADKFEDEEIDVREMFPKCWLQVPLQQRQRWMKLIQDSKESWDVELISGLRTMGMNFQILQHIYKIYQAEKKMKATRSSTPCTTPVSTRRPDTPRPRAPNKSLITRHLFKVCCCYCCCCDVVVFRNYICLSSYLLLLQVPGSNMSPMQKLQHAIKVRNRTLGPIKGTTLSPYLDVEVSKDNLHFLRLSEDDINMYNVLRQSTCKRGVRRKVAKRTLTALGGISGVCGILNGPEEMKDLRDGLKFAESLEQLRAKEKQRKVTALLERKKKQDERKRNKAAAQEKKKQNMTKIYNETRVKLGRVDMDILKKHVDMINGPQLKAVAFIQCNGEKLRGKVADMREQLRELLPGDLGVPEYPTQDEVVAEDAEHIPDEDGDTTPDEDGDTTPDEETRTVVVDIQSVADMNEGEAIEVYWKGEKKWYEGEITGIDDTDKTYEVLYHSDSAKLWHKLEDYPARYAC